ncbi:MAG TPA: tetratricopeptide repeat protein [Polyangia bacterium]|nr:tetratricopeptide repeat protein [Polyangia bacterium]
MASPTCDWRRPLCAAAAILLASPWARAAPPPGAAPPAVKQAAEAKLVAGVELLKAHSYREALARFEEGYALVPSPLIFYDIGLADRGLGDDARAFESFERFLAEAPDAPADKQRRAEAYRDELRARVSIVTLQADVGAAELTVDGTDLGRLPFPRRLTLAPGSHQVVARAGGSVQAATLTCVGGQTIPLAVRLSAPVPPIAPLPSEHALSGEQPRAPAVEVLGGAPATGSASGGNDLRPWALSAAAVGVASLGVGVAFGLMARNAGDQVTGDSQAGRTFVPTDETSGLRNQTVEVLLLSVGAVAVAAAVGLYVWSRHRAHAGPAAEAAR